MRGLLINVISDVFLSWYLFLSSRVVPLLSLVIFFFHTIVLFSLILRKWAGDLIYNLVYDIPSMLNLRSGRSVQFGSFYRSVIGLLLALASAGFCLLIPLAN